MTTPVNRYLRAALHCRLRDLEQLLLLCDLVAGINALIHALQKERGASSIFVGSGGQQFAEQLRERGAESAQCERTMRAELERIDQPLQRLSSAASFFYTRVATALQGLEQLALTREGIWQLQLPPQQVIKEFSGLVSRLLAVVFEIADMAADPAMAGALLALANFLQGKEYAGQERATGGAAISRGRFDEAETRRLRYLVAAQEHAFKLFCEFADLPQAAAFRELLAAPVSIELKRARQVIFAMADAELVGLAADAWYEWTTRRIDSMKQIEEQLLRDLKQLCATRLQATQQQQARDEFEVTATAIDSPGAPVAMLVTDVDPTRNNLGLAGGVGLFSLDARQARTIRPILDVIHAQSRRIDDVNLQLDSARTALSERKLIERAKGLLMQAQDLSENEAYELMRRLAMSHNKRLGEVAELIIERGGTR